MARGTEYVLWFDELKRQDVDLVGGKSSSLGEMTSNTQVPIPFGFATTAYGYHYFMKATGVESYIRSELAKLTDVEDTAQLHEVTANIRQKIKDAEMPKELEEAIKESYDRLSERVGEKDPYVAVRSSATAEDLPDASFAGQQDTFLNVKGGADVAQKVKECYASTFTERATYYREKQGFDHMQVALSASVQMMVYSKISGIMFSVDVATGNDKNIVIEGIWGLGEYIVGGNVSPDHYLVNKETLDILESTVNDKKIRLVRKEGGGTIEEEVPEAERKESVLTDAQVKELASYARTLEEHYGCYMDMEWAVDERTGKTWLLQARPETYWSKVNKGSKGNFAEESDEKSHQTTKARDIVVKGLPASPGIASGRAHIIMDPKNIDQFNKGEILVVNMTSPDWVPAMEKAVAIVTNAGGMTCHAAIVSRELGIPCIVGTETKGEMATKAIKDGQVITVDASRGVVYDGIVEALIKKETPQVAAAVAQEVLPITATKVYMNLGNPDMAEKYGKLASDGIGLMREEFIWTTFIHEHPLYLIETGRSDVVVDSLADGMRKVCEAMSPRQVVIRLSDFKSSEYRDLKGGDKYEPQEPSALLGWRGASRYYDERYLPAFKLELAAIKKVREEFGFKNLQVMIPFCRTVEEARKVTKIINDEGLVRSADFKLWMMAEIPSNIILADQFNQFIDGYSVGSNDLTMLILGCDRDNDTVQHIYDERNLAVRRAVKHLIEVAHKDGKTVSVCGQAPSVYPEFCEFLVKAGVDSISVNPDTVHHTKKMVAQLEQRLILDKLTGQGKTDSEDLGW